MQLGDKYLCSECIGEEFLRSQVRTNGHLSLCSYCGKDGRAFTIEEMAEVIELAFKDHFYQTSTEPSGMEYWEDRPGDLVVDVISEHALIEQEPAEDIGKLLEERHYDFDSAAMGEEGPFDSEARYAEAGVDDIDLQIGWQHFQQRLKTQSRYFSREAQETLASIFGGMEQHQTLDGLPVLVDAGPKAELKALYRARVFQSDEKLESALERPDVELGPPPAQAAVAGRMNARGISVFYGATDPQIALAEVRPPVGSRVLVGRFDLTRSIRLLDLEALRSVNVTGSIFDRDYIRRLRRAKFLKSLSERISAPVLPDDEPFDYLPTQAIADFLASEAIPPLDGIIYPSVQGASGKSNVVLFHKAAGVLPLDVPPGTTIRAYLYSSTEEGPEIDYHVFEDVPSTEDEGASATLKLEDVPFGQEPQSWSGSEGSRGQEPTLQLDTSSLEVHYIKAVTFQTESDQVRRYRSQGRSPKF